MAAVEWRHSNPVVNIEADTELNGYETMTHMITMAQRLWFRAERLRNYGTESCGHMPLTVGHGKSDWRKSGMYHVIDNVADAVYAADALKWDNFSMCIARPSSVLFPVPGAAERRTGGQRRLR